MKKKKYMDIVDDIGMKHFVRFIYTKEKNTRAVVSGIKKESQLQAAVAENNKPDRPPSSARQK